MNTNFAKNFKSLKEQQQDKARLMEAIAEDKEQEGLSATAIMFRNEAYRIDQGLWRLESTPEVKR